LRRSLTRIAGRASLLIAVAPLVWGCPAPGYDPHWRSKAQHALVLPLNVVATMPQEIRDGAHHVDKIMLDYLAASGKSVSTIGFRDAVAGWRAGEGDCRDKGAKNCDRFAGVAPFAARHLRTEHEYDVLIVPYLLLRGARTNGYVASFDGVDRLMKGSAPYGRYAYAYPYSGSPYPWSSSRIRAASLKVYGFSPEGKKVFEGIGGLDVVDQIEASDEGPGAYRIEVRENVLGDPDAVREGVARAFSKYVPRS
jgi:hypothetical protein